MNTSVAWLNEYLDPPASAAEQADLLTRAGFPIEHAEAIELPDGTRDFRQDVELTSNRGDCLCHIGLAREIAAISGRRLKVSTQRPVESGPPASTISSVTNQQPGECPLYMARLIQGVKVGSSPAWLANRLRARGDIPRNAIVDASNFVLFEMGQPTHVFDLAKLHGPRIIVRHARPGEPFIPIGEGAAELKLRGGELVIADADRPVALAGVKGGAPTAVTHQTTDILIEAATFAPASVRRSSRLHGIHSDSLHRFERGVHPGQVEAAADRLVALILELCGGTLCQGTLHDGPPLPPARHVTLRPDRCRKILGIPIDTSEMVSTLDRLGFSPVWRSEVIQCTVPPARLDIEREVDLIEEVGRMRGLDEIPVSPSIMVHVRPPEPYDLARRAVCQTLVGFGCVECVTHSLIAEPHAVAFLPPDLQALRLADDRTRAEPVLRPSIIPSLLRVLAHNRNNGVNDVRLFESASTFALQNDVHLETVNLSIVLPITDADAGIREMRGVIDRLALQILGPAARVHVEPTHQLPWFTPGASVRLNGGMAGAFGVLAPKTTAMFGLNETIVAAELGLARWYADFPPESEAGALPAFPFIERDVSAILDDRVPWADVEKAAETLCLQHAEAIEFVTTYRGKQIGAGRKSLTLRVRFRAPDRTLKHDEVDIQMHQLTEMLVSRFAAEIRG